MSETTELTVDLIYSAEQWRQLADLQQLIEGAAKAAYATGCRQRGTKGPHEVAINLSDDAAIQQLNHQYRGKDAATNVLSFPFDDCPQLEPGPKPLGDIMLAIETIRLEASQQDIPLDHHIAHLVVHGVLHLFDYDHMVGGEAEEMERLEVQILSSLHIPSPYRDL